MRIVMLSGIASSKAVKRTDNSISKVAYILIASHKILSMCKKETIYLLTHIPCGGVVIFDDDGKGKCSECGKTINVRISNK